MVTTTSVICRCTHFVVMSLIEIWIPIVTWRMTEVVISRLHSRRNCRGIAMDCRINRTVNTRVYRRWSMKCWVKSGVIRRRTTRASSGVWMMHSVLWIA